LSEGALKVLSRRNPSKLALSRGFRQWAISIRAHIAAAVLRDLNPQQWSRGSKMLVAGESGYRWLTAAGAFRWRFPNTLACARLVFQTGQYRNMSANRGTRETAGWRSHDAISPLRTWAISQGAAAAGQQMAQPVYPQLRK